MYFVSLVIYWQFKASLDFLSNSGHSDQMTMPARRASKFCAQRRAVSPEMFSQSMISKIISGICEPWSECQPQVSLPKGAFSYLLSLRGKGLLFLLQHFLSQQFGCTQIYSNL